MNEHRTLQQLAGDMAHFTKLADRRKGKRNAELAKAIESAVQGCLAQRLLAAAGDAQPEMPTPIEVAWHLFDLAARAEWEHPLASALFATAHDFAQAAAAKPAQVVEHD